MRRTTCFVMSRTDSQHLLKVLGEAQVPRQHDVWRVGLLIIAALLLVWLACREWLG